jgi:acylphosphatase
MDAVRRRVVVRGQVQGVGFRMNARARALELDLAGSAENLRDGSVLVEIEGAAPSVDAMLEWLRDGPRWAEVASLEIEELPPTGVAGFVVR